MKKRWTVLAIGLVVLISLALGLFIWQQWKENEALQPEKAPMEPGITKIYLNDKESTLQFYYPPGTTFWYPISPYYSNDPLFSLDELSEKLKLTAQELKETKSWEFAQKIGNQYYMTNSLGPVISSSCDAKGVLYIYSKNYVKTTIPVHFDDGILLFDEMLEETTKKQILAMGKETFLEPEIIWDGKIYPNSLGLDQWIFHHWYVPAKHFKLPDEKYSHFSYNTYMFLYAYYDHLEKEFAKSENTAQ